MPRIEVRKPAAGNSPPEVITLDICNHCYQDVGLKALCEGYDIPADLAEIDKLPTASTLGSLEVDHPPYESDQIVCYMCDDFLVEADNVFADPFAAADLLEDDDFDDDDSDDDIDLDDAEDDEDDDD